MYTDWENGQFKQIYKGLDQTHVKVQLKLKKCEKNKKFNFFVLKSTAAEVIVTFLAQRY